MCFKSANLLPNFNLLSDPTSNKNASEELVNDPIARKYYLGKEFRMCCLCGRKNQTNQPNAATPAK
jgi:hypothetical protein